MGWLDRLRSRVRRALDTGALARVLLIGSTSKAGATVTLTTAMQVSTVMACARVIGEGLAQTPVKLFQRSGEARNVVPQNAMHGLIADVPNDWMTSFELIEMIGLHAALAGNFFALTPRDSRGNVMEILPLQPGWVTVKQASDWSLWYRVKLPGAAERDFTASEVWHFRGPSWDGIIGMDAVANAREAIGLALAAEEFGSSLFSKGGRPGGVLTTDQQMSDEHKEQLREAWKVAHEGAGNAMKTAILEGGLKYEQLAMKSVDAELIATRRFVTEDICRFMRVLPIMVGSTGEGSPTYASAEQMFLAHVVHTLTPWFVRLEQSLGRHFLTAKERKSGLYFKFLPNGLMRGAAKDRADFYAKALGAGQSPAWMTPDEVRALEEMNPMGGMAAELPAPQSMQPQSGGTGA